MYSLQLLIVIASLALVFGVAAGAVAARFWLRPSQQKQLETRLHTTEQEMQSYQHAVAKHFIETSSRIEDLTRSYKALHEHLAQGAGALASREISLNLVEAGAHKVSQSPARAEESLIEPPRDWAPKTPGQRGALSEDYHLHEAEDTQEAPPPPYFTR